MQQMLSPDSCQARTHGHSATAAVVVTGVPNMKASGHDLAQNIRPEHPIPRRLSDLKRRVYGPAA